MLDAAYFSQSRVAEAWERNCSLDSFLDAYSVSYIFPTVRKVKERQATATREK